MDCHQQRGLENESDGIHAAVQVSAVDRGDSMYACIKCRVDVILDCPVADAQEIVTGRRMADGRSSGSIPEKASTSPANVSTSSSAVNTRGDTVPKKRGYRACLPCRSVCMKSLDLALFGIDRSIDTVRILAAFRRRCAATRETSMPQHQDRVGDVRLCLYTSCVSRSSLIAA